MRLFRVLMIAWLLITAAARPAAAAVGAKSLQGLFSSDERGRWYTNCQKRSSESLLSRH